MRTNPFTGRPLGAFPPPNDMAQVLSALRRRQAEWQNLTVAERGRHLSSALNYFDEQRETIARDITAEMGRPLTHARLEIDGLLERGHYLSKIAPSVLAAERVEPMPGFDRLISHEPLGIVFVISAWNFPLLITINGVMASLLAGNVVLLKHATQTLGIGRHFQEAFGDLLAHAVINHEDAARLLEDRQVDHVIFTGSVESGRQVYQHAAKGLLDCQLELGGKDGAYVAADADIDAAAEALVDGAMFNAGQSCCGVERSYVHADRHDEFVERCRSITENYVLGDPMDPETTMGPLAQPNQARLLEEHVADAVEKGATLLIGGQVRRIDHGKFFEPTLLTETNHTMRVMREENFGPIMPIMKVTDDDEAVSRINDSRYGLTAIIFTRDAERAESFARQANTGTVFQNRCDYLDPALPWTGVKDSGLGSALSKYGLLGVTRRKARHFKLD